MLDTISRKQVKLPRIGDRIPSLVFLFRKIKECTGDNIMQLCTSDCNFEYRINIDIIYICDVYLDYSVNIQQGRKIVLLAGMNKIYSLTLPTNNNTYTTNFEIVKLAGNIKLCVG